MLVSSGAPPGKAGHKERRIGESVNKTDLFICRVYNLRITIRDQ